MNEQTRGRVVSVVDGRRIVAAVPPKSADVGRFPASSCSNRRGLPLIRRAGKHRLPRARCADAGDGRPRPPDARPGGLRLAHPGDAPTAHGDEDTAPAVAGGGRRSRFWPSLSGAPPSSTPYGPPSPGREGSTTDFPARGGTCNSALLPAPPPAATPNATGGTDSAQHAAEEGHGGGPPSRFVHADDASDPRLAASAHHVGGIQRRGVSQRAGVGGRGPDAPGRLVLDASAG